VTQVFQYENLTWPEVAALDRHTSLVLPVGVGYSPSAVAESLGNPRRMGVLPSISFGFQGSVPSVSPSTFHDLLFNLSRNFKEDGFDNVHLVLPQGFSVGLDPIEIHLPLETEPYRITSSTADKVILIPIGHTEQHALHLPLSTDTICIDAIARGVAESIPEKVTCLPVMPYGVSTHRKSFAGSLNVGGRTFEDFWLDVIDSLVKLGYDKFYLITGHGGNVSFLTNMVKYTGEKYPFIFCATSWLYLSGPKGSVALQERRQSPLGGMGHACELETSLVLHLHPGLVRMDRVVDEMDFITTPSYFQDWLEGGPLIANPPWIDDTATGAYGAGSLATAEKGEYWLQVAIEEKIDHVNEIIEQQTRRTAKRLHQKDSLSSADKSA
jgi:creatinine amidohydrolase